MVRPLTLSGMFGFDLTTTIAAGVALAALLALPALFLAKNYAQLAGALAIGGLAWTAGGLTAGTFSTFVAAVFGTVVAAVDGALVGFGVTLPVSTGAVLLLLAALVLLSKTSKKKKG